MTTPKRVQMSRQRPWRAEHPDAVIVARPSRWGNPYPVGVEVTANWLGGEMATILATPEMAVAAFRDLMAGRLTRYPGDHPEDAAYVSSWERDLEALRGRDLACWCALDAPCHGDVLLELANEAVSTLPEPEPGEDFSDYVERTRPRVIDVFDVTDPER